MKKILLVLSLIMAFHTVYACDLCSIYLNLEPNDLKNSFGMNYRSRLFEHESNLFQTQNNKNKHAANNPVLLETLKQQELYRTVDVWSNFFIGQKWMLNLSMSFSDNKYVEDDSTIYTIGGIGDATAIIKYLVKNTLVTDSSKFINRLIIGGGVKIPTGSFNDSYTVIPSRSIKDNVYYGSPYEELDPHLQPGTGSVDFLILIEYLVRYKKLGLATNASYRINTTNSNQFRFANRLNANASLFAMFKLPKFSFAPNVGTAYEFSNRDQLSNESYINSGGTAVFLNVGNKVYINNVAIGATYFKPIKQNLNDSQLQNSNRVTIDLTYYF